MPTLEQIKSQISSLDGFSAFLGRKEIKELPNILWQDENIENIVQGHYKDGNGILVATNKRLVFVNKGLLWGLTVEDFAYDKISSTQYETGLLFGDLTIYTSGNKAVISQIDKKQARLFGDWLRNKLSSKTEKEQPAKEQPKNEININDDVVSKLERLAVLKSQGILTDEEFLEQKNIILGKR